MNKKDDAIIAMLKTGKCYADIIAALQVSPSRISILKKRYLIGNKDKVYFGNADSIVAELRNEIEMLKQEVREHKPYIELPKEEKAKKEIKEKPKREKNTKPEKHTFGSLSELMQALKENGYIKPVRLNPGDSCVIGIVIKTECSVFTRYYTIYRHNSPDHMRYTIYEGQKTET